MKEEVNSTPNNKKPGDLWCLNLKLQKGCLFRFRRNSRTTRAIGVLICKEVIEDS